jgi:hypothetical protein
MDCSTVANTEMAVDVGYRKEPNMADLPIACTLGDDALRARKSGLLASVIALATKTTEIETGYRWEFTAEALPEIIAMIDAERRCCRFLRFAVTVEPDFGPIVVELTGPSGTREFLETLMGSE